MDIDPEVSPGLQPAPQDKVKELKRQTDEVIETMEHNVKILVEREKDLEGLKEGCENLKEKAKDFKWTAQKVERSYCLKNVKMVVVIVVVVLVIILIIVLLATGVIPVDSSSSSSTPLPIPLAPKP